MLFPNLQCTEKADVFSSAFAWFNLVHVFGKVFSRNCTYWYLHYAKGWYSGSLSYIEGDVTLYQFLDLWFNAACPILARYLSEWVDSRTKDRKAYLLSGEPHIKMLQVNGYEVLYTIWFGVRPPPAIHSTLNWSTLCGILSRVSTQHISQ